ncbi:MAG TPA: VOC family protein [Polyangiaceae bacterium]|nr:VOC family protein [Polyangiaceae bacterium]
MHVASVDHIHVYGLDPLASVAFWQRHFGGESVFQTKNVHDQDVHLVRVGAQVLAFSEFPPGRAPGPPAADAAAALEGMSAAGVMHLGVRVRDVAAAAAELRRAGVPVYGEPRAAHGVTFVYVQAPDGVLVELTEYEAA